MSAFKVQRSAVAKTAADCNGSLASVRAFDQQSFGRHLPPSCDKACRTAASEIFSRRVDVSRWQFLKVQRSATPKLVADCNGVQPAHDARDPQRHRLQDAALRRRPPLVQNVRIVEAVAGSRHDRP